MDDTILLSHGAMGLSYLVEAVDKHRGEKCLNLNAKKGQAYEDRQKTCIFSIVTYRKL